LSGQRDRSLTPSAINRTRRGNAVSEQPNAQARKSSRVARPLLLWSVSVLGVAVVVEAAPWQAGLMALSFALAGFVFESFPAKLDENIWASLTFVALMIGIMIGGLQLAIAVTLGECLRLVLTKRGVGRVVKGFYNLGMFAIAALVATLTFELVAGVKFVHGPDLTLGMWVFGVVLATAAHYAVNVLLMALVLRVSGGADLRVVLRGLAHDGWWSQLLTAAFALAGYVVFVEAGALALGLLLVPIVTARRSMQGLAVQRDSLDRAVRALVRLVEVKDEYTCGHAERVADLSDQVAASMGLTSNERYWIRIGAVLHDVGKVGVPLDVLTKPGRLTDDEYWHMRRHPDLGADLLATVDALAPAVPLVRQHHERIDGCGYPRGLKGDQVPLATRIVSAVDSWDAMTTSRPYRTALPTEVAVSELVKHRGSQFDSAVVVALIAIVAPELAGLLDTVPAAEPAASDRFGGHIHPQARVAEPEQDAEAMPRRRSGRHAASHAVVAGQDASVSGQVRV
jgi:hypothetical protein